MTSADISANIANVLKFFALLLGAIASFLAEYWPAWSAKNVDGTDKISPLAKRFIVIAIGLAISLLTMLAGSFLSADAMASLNTVVTTVLVFAFSLLGIVGHHAIFNKLVPSSAKALKAYADSRNRG